MQNKIIKEYCAGALWGAGAGAVALLGSAFLSRRYGLDGVPLYYAVGTMAYGIILAGKQPIAGNEVGMKQIFISLTAFTMGFASIALLFLVFGAFAFTASSPLL